MITYKVNPISDSSLNKQSPPTAPLPDATIIGRAEHGISRAKISPSCLKVLYKLNEAGYQAYIVGGGVRDILLGLEPKDFDIATDATPEQVQAEFRNARIIGRRFRIVHVQFGREIIEVSTFRALGLDSVEVPQDHIGRKVKHLDSVHSANGMILRDNVYGTMEEDVIRRDFTANALYYTVRNFEVHDYVSGMADINNRCLRMIGDPVQRYREDPVRILRAIRLASKLGFTIEQATEAPIKSSAHLLASIPSARLFDEFMKLFFSGKAASTYEALSHYGVFEHLFPVSSQALAEGDPIQQNILNLAFASTDQRINAGKSITPAFLLAAILWPALQAEMKQLLAQGLPAATAMHEAAQTVLSEQLQRISIPKRFSIPMREIWDLQLRLNRRLGKRAEALVGHRRFRAAYDFVLIREQAGEDLGGLGQWWTEYQQASTSGKEKLQSQIAGNKDQHSKSRKRRVKSNRSGARKGSQQEP